MKTDKQYRDSMMFFCIAALGLFLTMLAAAIYNWCGGSL